MLAITMVLATVLVGRLVQLQVVDGASSTRRAADLTTRAVVIPALRGRILAADGSVIVDNSSTMTLTITPEALAKPSAREVLARVAAVLGRPVTDLERRTATCGTKGAPPAPVCFSGQPFEPVPFASDVDPQLVNAILEQPERYPGVAAASTPTRTYGSSGASVAQLVGYLTTTTADDVAAARRAHRAVPSSDALLGRAGLEQQYDLQLRGRDGVKLVTITPDGRAQRVVSTTAPTNGRDVRTTIDPTLQKAAAEALARGIASARKAKQKADSGSVVVMDADTGAIAALTNAPTYDPSVWNGGISQAEYATLTGSGADPLADRAVSVADAPGSTFKAASLFAAARRGVDPKGMYECPSSLTIGNRTFTNFESEAYGRIDVPKAIEVSCDTVFYRWAYRSWLDAGGTKAAVDAPDPYATTARSFGFGAATGVDLPAEATGVVTDRKQKRRDWEATKKTSCERAQHGYPEIADKARASYLTQIAKENCTSGYELRAGDAVNFAIGQGDVTATPLQLAGAYALLVNGGHRVRPHVASDDGDRSGATTQATVSLDARMLAVARQGFARAISAGTASGAFAGFDLTGFPLAGKTGTAEVYGKQPTSWFVSYMPQARGGHRYVVVVRVEEGGEGGKTAAPIARGVWDAILRQTH